jgi:hypothetical protein
MDAGGGKCGFFSSDFIIGFFSSTAIGFRGSGSGFCSSLNNGFSSLMTMGSGGSRTGFSSDFKRFFSVDFRSDNFTNTLDLGVRSGGIIAKIDACQRDRRECGNEQDIFNYDLRQHEAHSYQVEQHRRIVAFRSISTEYSTQNVLKVIVCAPESHSTSGKCCTFFS